ncbi:MAG: serine/threonine protein kinase, partial [Acidobacteria bacterium]|nr:serine/threonine protein kinase [Acidobacteriota bacterium]
MRGGAVTPERWRRVEDLFQAALERGNAERELFLAATCEDDQTLRDEIDSLLKCAPGADEVIHQAVNRAADSLEATFAEVEGRRIGPYQLVRELGRGGMGEVHLATRADGEYQKQVAIKLVRRGLDTDLLLDRFRQERQILARLEHPNIARLLDGGATGDGLPFLVMEYIDGESVTAYCERKNLPERERLELFRQVCAAVQYAHQNLVVHRDLKPSNILVTTEGTPKLLDFGIAKLLGPVTDAGDPAATVTQLRAMTPQYASPEQVDGRPITTATDVYALGAILYELVTGRKAHCFQNLTPEEIRRVVCFEEPGRAATVETQVEKDLDNIARMAMRKEPQRRYASAEQLSEDLRRYLEGRPVRARPDTLGYRTGKFIRRNKLGVAAGVTVLALSLGFAVTANLQAVRIGRERDKAQQVTQFLVESFRGADPGETRGNSITAREILDKGVEKVSRDLRGQPEVQASLMDTMGQVYSSLGLYEKAATLFRQAVDLRRRLPDQESVELAVSLNHLGDTLRARGEFLAAETSLREALAIQRKRLGNVHQDVAGTLNNLGILFNDKREFSTGEAFLRESLTIYGKLQREDTIDATTTRENLAELLNEKGDYAAAEPLLRQTLASLRKLLGDDHPHVANTVNTLGVLLYNQGDAVAAERAYREALAMRRKVLGSDHPDVATTLSSLALLWSTRGDVAEAEPLYREALAIHLKSMGPQHPQVAVDRNNLALLLVRRGDRIGAEREFRDALAIETEALGRENADTARCMHNLAGVLHDMGRRREALPLYREALEIRRKTLPSAHFEIGTSLAGLGRLLTDRGDARAAEPLLREAVSIQRNAVPAGHWRIADAESILGECLTALHRFEAAEPLLVPSYELLVEKRGASDYRTQMARVRLRKLYQAW